MAKIDLKEWARRGAEARAAELQEELARIYRAFPGLRGGRGRRGGGTAASAGGAEPVRRRRRRSRMTAAQKKAVSVRMKKYWADRRKAKGK